MSPVVVCVVLGQTDCQIRKPGLRCCVASVVAQNELLGVTDHEQDPYSRESNINVCSLNRVRQVRVQAPRSHKSTGASLFAWPRRFSLQPTVKRESNGDGGGPRLQPLPFVDRCWPGYFDHDWLLRGPAADLVIEVGVRARRSTARHMLLDRGVERSVPLSAPSQPQRSPARCGWRLAVVPWRLVSVLKLASWLGVRNNQK